MHYHATLLTLLVPLTLSNALNIIKQRTDLGSEGPIAGTLVCSADTSKSVTTSWSTDPLWNTQMTNCLGELNNADFNGAQCTPTTNGSPSFGFWKTQSHGINGQDCYDTCQACLKRGIDKGLGVTTSCRWTADGVIEDYQNSDKSQTCGMGFDYGT